MVLFIGEILADISMNTDTGKMRAYLGGAPYNAAVSCARNGAPARFLGRVGDDPIGRFLRSKAALYPVETHLQVDPVRPTTIAFVSIDETGERDFKFLRHDAADYAVEPDESLWTGVDVVHLGSLMLSEPEGRALAARIMEKAKKENVATSFDVNLREDVFRNKEEALRAYAPLLAGADVVKFGEEEVVYFYGKGYEEAFSEMNNPLVVVTRGKDGCVVKRKDDVLRVPAVAVKPVDTTGAGDAFYGAFLAGIAGKNIETITKEELFVVASRANDAGGAATLYKGAIRV